MTPDTISALANASALALMSLILRRLDRSVRAVAALLDVLVLGSPRRPGPTHLGIPSSPRGARAVTYPPKKRKR